MQFPELPRIGDESRASALRRLHDARDDYSQLAEGYASEGASAEPAAAARLNAHRAEVAACEAWLVWVERGGGAETDGKP
ncbi:MAG: hypothetical protein QOD76_211 [Solirubrobacteraceae bacterium]|jgi:hypothetical protein|nr:hypothetical protein [Solirubrobacteraceae bacterium]